MGQTQTHTATAEAPATKGALLQVRVMCHCWPSPRCTKRHHESATASRLVLACRLCSYSSTVNMTCSKPRLPVGMVPC